MANTIDSKPTNEPTEPANEQELTHAERQAIKLGNDLIKSIHDLPPEIIKSFADVNDGERFTNFLESKWKEIVKLVPQKNRKEFTEKYRSMMNMLHKSFAGIDKATDIPNKNAISEEIKSEITKVSKMEGEERDEKMKKTGLIYFDVRGLKAVNDATGDHKVGDAFLKRIAAEASSGGMKIIQKLVGTEAKLSLGRDGGDEFAVLIKNSAYDLDQEVTEKSLVSLISDEEGRAMAMQTYKNIIAERQTIYEKQLARANEAVDPEEKALRVAEVKMSTEPVRFIDVIARALQDQMATKECSDIISAEQIKEHLQRGNRAFNNPAIEGFKMPIMIAAGGESMYRALREPKPEYIKTFSENIDDLTPEAKLNVMFGIVRMAADKKSYAAKDDQNFLLLNSTDNREKLIISMLSRNEFTVALGKKLDDLFDTVVGLRSQIEALTETHHDNRDKINVLQLELDSTKEALARCEAKNS